MPPKRYILPPITQESLNCSTFLLIVDGVNFKNISLSDRCAVVYYWAYNLLSPWCVMILIILCRWFFFSFGNFLVIHLSSPLLHYELLDSRNLIIVDLFWEKNVLSSSVTFHLILLKYHVFLSFSFHITVSPLQESLAVVERTV